MSDFERKLFFLDLAELESEIDHVKKLIKKRQRNRRTAEDLLVDNPGDLRLTVQLEVAKEKLVKAEIRLRNLQAMKTAFSINKLLQVSEYVLYTTLPTGVLHLYDRESLPLVEFTITNNTDEPQSVSLTSWIEGYTFHRTDQVDIEPEESRVFPQLPKLDVEKIKHITEIRSAVLHTKVEYLLDGERKQLRAQDYDVEFLARNVIRWAIPAVGDKPGEYQSLAHHIGAWVTPRVESVQEVLRHAVDFHPDKAMVGYQEAPNSETARKQVKAIFQALKKKVKLAYVSSPFAFGAQPGEVLQTVRLPRESLEMHSANCIDGTVLYASLMKLANLNPVIVLQTDHAFVGWEMWPESGEYEFVETTMILEESFEKAHKRGMEEYQDLLNKGWFDRPLFDPKGFALLLSLDDLYQRGIKPMEGMPSAPPTQPALAAALDVTRRPSEKSVADESDYRAQIDRLASQITKTIDLLDQYKNIEGIVKIRERLKKELATLETDRIQLIELEKSFLQPGDPRRDSEFRILINDIQRIKNYIRFEIRPQLSELDIQTDDINDNPIA